MTKTVTVDLNELRQKKLFIATPMYGGQCFGSYTLSLYNTTVKAQQLGIQISPYFIYNESLIQRARNYCVDQFLQGDSTHMIFIDADIGWKPDEIFMMLNECDEDTPIVCGPYPKKEIAWEKIRTAVHKGVGESNPDQLKEFVGDYVFNLGDSGPVDIREMFEVTEAGTGFMMIHRSAFEKIRAKWPKRTYKPDHLRSKDFNGQRDIYIYFDCAVDPKTKRYLSEDYYFCHQARKAGCKIMMAPWAALTHTGTFEFGGTVANLVAIGASLTGGNLKKQDNQ